MARFVDSRLVKTFQTTLRDLRKDLGRTITIWYKTGDPTVPTGTLDPVNLEPVDPTNPLVPTKTVKTIKYVIIHYGPEDNPFVYTPGGRLEQGEVRLSMKLRDVLVDQSDVNGDTYFESAIKVIIDGNDFEVKGKPIKTGLRDLYSCVVICKLKE